MESGKLPREGGMKTKVENGLPHQPHPDDIAEERAIRRREKFEKRFPRYRNAAEPKLGDWCIWYRGAGPLIVEITVAFPNTQARRISGGRDMIFDASTARRICTAAERKAVSDEAA